MNQKLIVTAGILLLVAVAIGWKFVEKFRDEDPMQDRYLLKRGMDKPVAWVYVNSGDVNARSWRDFMDRSSRAMNLPFLNLCFGTAVAALGSEYRIEVIGGLQDLARRLGGWEALPTPLQNPDVVVRAPELNWIRAAVLAKWGGLWVTPSALWLRPLPSLPADKVVFFGTDPEETNSSEFTMPSLYVLWSPKAGHPLWIDWEAKARARLERRSGGSEFRRDELSDAHDAVTEYADLAEIRVRPEISRKGGARRRIQLEDLLAAGQEGAIPFQIPADGSYIPIPYPEILDREAFGWFLRMSEEQILESDLVLSHLFRRAAALTSPPLVESDLQGDSAEV